jgi:hypothetical protein
LAITFEHREQFLSYMPSMLLEKFVFGKTSKVGIKLLIGYSTVEKSQDHSSHTETP